jgi:hypothetical protein
LSRTYIEEKKSSSSGITHAPGSFRPGHLPEVLGVSRCVSCKDKDSSKIPGVCDEPDRKLHCVAKSWTDISPVYYLTDGFSILPSDYVFPNFIIVHGDSDVIVNKEQADEMITALKQKAISHSFVNVENGKHGFSFSKNNDETVLEKGLVEKILNSLKIE